MRTIAIANYKGGTCKTTTALNLAAELVAKGKRVLLIDGDSSANATVGIGLKPVQPPPLLYALDVPPVPLAEGIVSSSWDVDVVPSGKRLSFVDHVLDEHNEPTLALRKAIGSLDHAPYDFVLIDCPAQYGVMTRLAMTASDEILVPIETKSADSVDGLISLWRDMGKVRKRDQPDLRVAGILCCRVDRTVLSRELIGELRDHKVFGPHLVRTQSGKVLTIREAVSVAEARVRQVSVREHDPEGKGATDYAALAAHILEYRYEVEEAA